VKPRKIPDQVVVVMGGAHVVVAARGEDGPAASSVRGAVSALRS
jgi:hypothetical protein